MTFHNYPAGDLIVLDTGEMFLSLVSPHCQHVAKPQSKVIIEINPVAGVLDISSDIWLATMWML
jgi:hypothetical protein